ncbi:transposase [Ralstonia pseudosolanacearum]
MKTSKFTEAQIAFVRKQAKLGTKVEEVCRKLRYQRSDVLQLEEEVRDVGPSELRRMRQLKKENAKLKQLVADLSLTKACALFHMSRSLYGYRSVARDSSALLARIKDIAVTRMHYGYRRVAGKTITHAFIACIGPKAYRCGVNAPSATSRRGYASPRGS